MMIFRPQHGTPPPAPFERGNAVDTSLNPEAVAHYRDQMAELKARIMTRPRDRVGPLGRIAEAGLRQRGWKR
jgi:hypothetical protein